MSASHKGMIAAFGAEVEARAGKTVRAGVMVGSDTLKSNAGGADVARWVRGAVERLDHLLDRGRREAIMDACGENCARRNGRVLSGAKTRRARFKTLDDFLSAEVKKPLAGTRLRRTGPRSLEWTYLPRSFGRGMRCFCRLLRGLPEGETASRTWCQCSKGFVRTFWTEALGRPVAVKVLETAVTGSDQCRFRVSFR